MHVVVVGCGRVGSELAGSLERDGHSVAVVDKKKTAFSRLPPGFAGTAVVGFGFDRDHLAAAGIERAGAFASVTNGDNSNILCARIARETYGIEHVVARIYDPRRALIYQRLGIPTVATVAWTTDQVLRRLIPNESRRDWIDPSGKVCLVERSIPEWWVGKPLRGIDESGQFWLTAVTRFGTCQITAENVVGQEGDILHVMSGVEFLDALDHRLSAGADH